MLARDLRRVAAGQLDEALPAASVHHRSGLLAQRRAGGVALPAAPSTAGAGDAAVGHDHVADLAGEAVGAAHEPAVDDEPAPDAGAEGDEDRRVGPGGGAGLVLGPGGAGGVVVGPDGEPEGLGQGRPHRQLDDAGQVGGEAEGAVTVDQPGQPDAEGGGGGRLGPEGGGHRDQALDQPVGIAEGGLLVLGHHRAVVVEDDAEDLGPADVEAEGRQRQ